MSRSFGIDVSLLVAVLALPACGGKSFDTGGGDPHGGADEGGTTSGAGTSAGGRAQGGTSVGGSANGGTSAGGTTSGGTTSGGSGGSAQCDAFGNESGTTVQVEITNETKMPIHLGQLTPSCAGAASMFSVADAAGKSLGAPGFCATTCDDVIHGTIRACPAIACAISSPITLQPGESLMTQWTGEFLVDKMLPPACRPADGQSDCQRIEGVKPGAFTFSAQAGTKIDCTQFGGGACSACMPNKEGGCTTFGGVIVAPLLTAETKVMLDGSYGVGGGGGGGQVNSVQIVFKN